MDDFWLLHGHHHQLDSIWANPTFGSCRFPMHSICGVRWNSISKRRLYPPACAKVVNVFHIHAFLVSAEGSTIECNNNVNGLRDMMVRVSGSHYTIYKPGLCERRLFLSMKICVIIVFVHYQLNTLDSVFSYKLLCTERNYCEPCVSFGPFVVCIQWFERFTFPADVCDVCIFLFGFLFFSRYSELFENYISVKSLRSGGFCWVFLVFILHADSVLGNDSN